MERVVAAAMSYIDPLKQNEQARYLCLQLLVNYAVHNADCHAKNLALIYENERDVQFSPAYDVVTTAAYPEFKHDAPGLSVDGRKNWSMNKSLGRFMRSRLGITTPVFSQEIERVADAVVDVSMEVAEAARNDLAGTMWPRACSTPGMTAEGPCATSSSRNKGRSRTSWPRKNFPPVVTRLGNVSGSGTCQARGRSVIKKHICNICVAYTISSDSPALTRFAVALIRSTTCAPAPDLGKH